MYGQQAQFDPTTSQIVREEQMKEEPKAVARFPYILVDRVEKMGDVRKFDNLENSCFGFESIMGWNTTAYEFRNVRPSDSNSDALMQALGIKWFDTIQSRSYSSKWEIIAFGRECNIRVVFDTIPVKMLPIYEGNPFITIGSLIFGIKPILPKIDFDALSKKIYEALFVNSYLLCVQKNGITSKEQLGDMESFIEGATIEASLAILVTTLLAKAIG